MLPEPLTRLVEQLQRLPGIGAKGAQRLAFHVLKTRAKTPTGSATPSATSRSG
jgi:recombination protein RecR